MKSGSLLPQLWVYAFRHKGNVSEQVGFPWELLLAICMQITALWVHIESYDSLIFCHPFKMLCHIVIKICSFMYLWNNCFTQMYLHSELRAFLMLLQKTIFLMWLLMLDLYFLYKVMIYQRELIASHWHSGQEWICVLIFLLMSAWLSRQAWLAFMWETTWRKQVDSAYCRGKQMI